MNWLDLGLSPASLPRSKSKKMISFQSVTSTRSSPTSQLSPFQLSPTFGPTPAPIISNQTKSETVRRWQADSLVSKEDSSGEEETNSQIQKKKLKCFVGFLYFLNKLTKKHLIGEVILRSKTTIKEMRSLLNNELSIPNTHSLKRG